MNKIVVINGRGGIGKDTLIDSLRKDDDIHVTNVSSITPIIQGLEQTPFVGNETASKDLAYRKLLSRTKAAVDAYWVAQGISYTNSYLKSRVKQWNKLCDLGKAKHHILFVHIREPESIDDFVQDNQFIDTLLITSDRSLDNYGNDADDGVYDYCYRYVFEANGTKEEEARAFHEFIKTNILKEEIQNG